tara:strand:- start:14485 stop:14916 length:432 start_codon:yes stop_codon:yes gene_type:complete
MLLKFTIHNFFCGVIMPSHLPSTYLFCNHYKNFLTKRGYSRIPKRMEAKSGFIWWQKMQLRRNSIAYNTSNVVCALKQTWKTLSKRERRHYAALARLCNKIFDKKYSGGDDPVPKVKRKNTARILRDDLSGQKLLVHLIVNCY